jgi:hypothetical protein
LFNGSCASSWRNKLKRAHHIELSPTATWSDAIAATRVTDAVLETSAAREIREAIEGKSTMRVEMSSTQNSNYDGEFGNDWTLEEARNRVTALTRRLRAKYAQGKAGTSKVSD